MAQNILLALFDSKLLNQLSDFIKTNFADLKVFSETNYLQLKEIVPREKPALMITDLRLFTNSSLKSYREFDTDLVNEIKVLNPRTNVIIFCSEESYFKRAGLYNHNILAYFSDRIEAVVLKPYIEKALLLDEVENMPVMSNNSKKLDPSIIGDYIVLENTDTEKEYLKALKVAKDNEPVLILGETGTGKEHLAKFVHNSSNRKAGPLITINIKELSQTTIESQLFGHKKGSFTGAIQDFSGVVSSANGGTLFLDEIGNLDLNIQNKLLRFIQFGEYYRIGDIHPLRVDVRIIAVTNKSEQELKSGTDFKPDLYYRLAVHKLKLKPLKDRSAKEKIALANFLLNSYVKENNKSEKHFDADALKIIIEHNWTGSVRDLRGAIIQTYTASDNNFLPGLLMEKLIKDNI